MSSAVCSPAADSAFGPAVEGCRQGFDFTFAFESYFFSIVPSVLLLCFAPLRFKTLSRVRPKIKGNAFKYVKLVSGRLSLPCGLQLIVCSPGRHHGTRCFPIGIDRTFRQQHTSASMETSNGSLRAILWIQHRSLDPLIHGAF